MWNRGKTYKWSNLGKLSYIAHHVSNTMYLISLTKSLLGTVRQQ